MRVDASPPSPHRVAAILCVALLAACYGDDPVQVDEPSFARPVAPDCPEDGGPVLVGNSPLTIRAFDENIMRVKGFTASVFNECGRIREAQDTANDGAVTFMFAAGAQVFVLAQGGITEDAAKLNIAPAASEGILDLDFAGAPLNKARLTLAGPANTILSVVPTLGRFQTAVQQLPVTVKNSGTELVMILPDASQTDAVREVLTFNLSDAAALPVAAIQVLERRLPDSEMDLETCGLFETVNPFCESAEGVGLIRGLDVLGGDPAILVTSQGDVDENGNAIDCVVEVLATAGDQGLINASALCSDGVDSDLDSFKEILLFARPAFCDLSATETALDEVGDGSVFDFLSLQVGAVAAGPYPGGTFPDPNAIAVIGDGLLRIPQDVTLTLTVKEVLADGGSSVRSINVALKPDITCMSDDVEAPAFCVPDPRGFEDETGTLVLWNVLVSGLQTGSVREVGMNVKGQDAMPDPDKSAGARVLVPGLPPLTEGVCAVENGGGRFSPIGG